MLQGCFSSCATKQNAIRTQRSLHSEGNLVPRLLELLSHTIIFIQDKREKHTLSPHPYASPKFFCNHFF